MVRIAIAGGTGGLGRTLVEEFQRSEEHEIFVLSRKPTLPFAASPNVHCLAAPYDSVENLIEVLNENNVHTLISTLNPPTPEVHRAEINLIRAASSSNTVKRFVPSEWGIDMSYGDEHLPLSWKTFKQDVVKELEKHPNLEYTLFYNGYFMDYFGTPHAPSYMLAEVPYIDIAAGKAAIPGSGNEKVVFTYTKDVAKFARKVIEANEPWSRTSVIIGDTITMNEALGIAEKARGIKFDVVYDTLEDLRAGRITEIPAYKALYPVYSKNEFLSMMSAFGVGMATGVFDLKGASLNEKFGDVQPTKVVDFILKYWEGK